MNEKPFPPGVSKIPKGTSSYYHCWNTYATNLNEEVVDGEGDILVRPGITRMESSVIGCDSGVRYVLDYINNSCKQFDGFCSFSQGCLMVCRIYECLQTFKECRLTNGKRLPFFTINFSGYNHPLITFTINKGQLSSFKYAYPGFCHLNLELESIHLTSKRDDGFIHNTEF